MAAIGASDVTYTLVSESMIQAAGGGRRRTVVKVAFGDASKTYPSGGVPLTGGNMGAPTLMEALSILDASNGDGYVYKWDQTNNKIRIYERDQHTHNLYLATGTSGTAVKALAGKIENSTAATVTGRLATASGSGVIAAAVHALAELSTSAAPASTTLVVEVLGY